MNFRLQLRLRLTDCRYPAALLNCPGPRQWSGNVVIAQLMSLCVYVQCCNIVIGRHNGPMSPRSQRSRRRHRWWNWHWARKKERSNVPSKGSCFCFCDARKPSQPVYHTVHQTHWRFSCAEKKKKKIGALLVVSWFCNFLSSADCRVEIAVMTNIPARQVSVYENWTEDGGSGLPECAAFCTPFLFGR